MSARAAGPALASAAEALVGARFRLHGRDPATGLAGLCVLAAALASALVVRRRIDALDMVAALKTRE